MFTDDATRNEPICGVRFELDLPLAVATFSAET